MKRLSLLVLALLTILCAVQFARVTDLAAQAAHLPHFEPGRRRSASLSEETRTRLASFDEEVRLTYFATRRENLPAHLAHLEDHVRDVLGAFEQASSASARPMITEVVYLDEHPEWQISLATAGVAPWRSRRVEGDGYRDDELWSSLRIGYGARPEAVFNGVGPEMVDQLQELILAQLEELREPRRPRVALSAPAGYDILREILNSGADVIEVDFDDSAELPTNLDLFLWLDPQSAEEQHLAAIERLRARGGSVVFAGHSLSSTETWNGEDISVRFTRDSQAAGTVLRHFGLTPLGELLLDPRGGEILGPDLTGSGQASIIAPWYARSTADHHDFRTLKGQPNGSLLFRTPEAFLPDGARLAELNLKATVLATASDLATSVAVPSNQLTFAELLNLKGRAQPNAALAAILRPADPWSGRLLMLADSAVLNDEFAVYDHYAHTPLVQILLTTLLSGERMVASRIALVGPEVLPQLASVKRALLHGLVVLLVPSLFALMFLIRNRGGSGGSAQGRIARAVTVPICVSIPLAVFASTFAPALDVDLTKDGRNRLTDTEREVFAGLLEEPTQIELVFSEAGSLPPEFKPLAREVRRVCDGLAREFDTVSVSSIHPEGMDESQLADLAQGEVTPFSVSTTSAEVTRLFRIYAHLRLSRGENEVVIGFPTERSFGVLRFRLAHALTRLQGGSPTRVAIFAEPPRLSPAEAALEYQRKKLFAPREGDVFSEIADLLSENDFEVVRLNPAIDAIPENIDAVLWLQPRRDIRPMMARLSVWLHEGGKALVAGQHFRILSRQLENAGLQQRFWPEPQFVDLDRYYFNEIGIKIERELVFDESYASLPLTTRVDGTDGSTKYIQLETTQPFLVRAAALGRDTHTIGELLLPFASKLRFDEELIATTGLRHSPWVLGVGPHWSYRWTGGDLAPELLRGEPAPDDETNALLLFDSPASYAELVSGTFPKLEFQEAGEDKRPGELALVVLPDKAQAEGHLLVVGNSKLFENELLGLEGYDHELFALRAASRLSLDAQIASFLDKAPSAPALAPQSKQTRLWWRLIVMGAFPLLLIVVGAGRRRISA
ncbi:MAG: hypothetical protein ACI8X5_001177 [Planctomycetota bacterium]